MIAYLQVFQFVFLYCFILLIGLFVYGSEMNALAGKLYAISLISILIFIFIFKRWFTLKVGRWSSRLILFIGGACGLYLYKTLHFNYWDEHSLPQSILMSVLALCSFFAANLGTKKVTYEPTKMALALGIIATTWLASTHYPMAPIFVISLILLFSLLDNTEFSLNLQRGKIKCLRPETYLLFISVLDISLVVWDYQVNSFWGFHLFLSLMGVALVQAIYPQVKHKIKPEILYLLLAINFVLAIIFPVFVLHWSHSLISGLLLGVLVSNLYLYEKRNDNSHKSSHMRADVFVTIAPAVIWGLVIGYAFYANLEHSQWRAVLLLPALILFLHRWNTQKSIGSQ